MIHPCVKIAKRCTNSHHIKLFSISLKSHWSSLADFRSDTVTKPCDNMRNAMLRADVGDDVYGEDPSVNKLEEFAAYISGMESALFVPSGTMGNLIAVGVHCGRGEEVILGSKSHMYLYEAGGASAFMGVSYACVPNKPDGTINLNEVYSAIREDDVHCPRTKLLALENTQNWCGGRPLPVSFLDEASEFAKKNDLKLHIDGARLANAAIAQRTTIKRLLLGCDSACICLSKGLGAPVGSVLVGNSKFIAKARRLRKGLGGGMRQAGVLAAAGLEAFVNNFSRLSDDHKLASTFSSKLSKVPGVEVIHSNLPSTNMVYFNVSKLQNNEIFMSKLKTEFGVLVGGGYGFNGQAFRAVTHLNVGEDEVDRAVSAIRGLTESNCI